MTGLPTKTGEGTAQSRRKRVTRACDQCHQTRSKCDGHLPCARCLNTELTCAYLRVRKKRGKVRSIGPTQRTIRESTGHTQQAIEEVAQKTRSQVSEYACTRNNSKGIQTTRPQTLSSDPPADRPHMALTSSHHLSPSISLDQIQVTGVMPDGQIVDDTKDQSPTLISDVTVKNDGDRLIQVEQTHTQIECSDFPVSRNWSYIQTTSQPESTDPLYRGIHVDESQHELQDLMHLSSQPTIEEAPKRSGDAKLTGSILAGNNQSLGNDDNLSASTALEETPQGRVAGHRENCIDILCRTLQSLVRRTIAPQASATKSSPAFDGRHDKEIFGPGWFSSDLTAIVPVSVAIELLEHFFSDRSMEYTRRQASQLSAEEIRSLVDYVARGVISSHSALISSALLMAAQTSVSRFLMSPPSARFKVSQKLHELTTRLLASVPLNHANLTMTTESYAGTSSNAVIMSDAATLVHLTFATTLGEDTGSRCQWSGAACAQISSSNDKVETWLSEVID